MAVPEGVGIVVGSANARVGMASAIEILRGGGSAIDAAIAAAREVEDDPNDFGVGTGGTPNILGEVQLDASIMDGRNLASGAVGAVRNYPHPIDIARKVMELTPHVMLVGEGAELFARVHGFETSQLLTEDRKEIWEEVVGGKTNGQQKQEDIYNDRYLYMQAINEWTDLLHEEIFGTTNIIARDSSGNIACAVTTSGWGYKWPGRLGDSPIIAAGNYADNRYGAAACTGRGEMAIRCATAHSVVQFMRFGMSLDDALVEAMKDLRHLDDPYAVVDSSTMNIVGMDKDGTVSAVSTSPTAGYVYQRTDMESYEEPGRIHVPL